MAEGCVRAVQGLCAAAAAAAATAAAKSLRSCPTLCDPIEVPSVVRFIEDRK